MAESQRTEHLVTVSDLTTQIESVQAPVLLDVRWRLGDEDGDGRRRYAEGHLPGARFLDLERVLTRHTDDPLDGRHPLPDHGNLERGLGALGLHEDDDLVVYDEPGSFGAARAWWVLRWAGLRVRVLDGGISAWAAAGGPLEHGEPEPSAVTRLRLTTGALPTLDIDEAADFPAAGTLLDARAPERYRGEVEPLDPRAGHIPGAVNLSAATLFTDDGRLLPDDELVEQLRPLVGFGPVAAYCGSGVSAAQDVLALAVLGVPAALFPGSWSAWSNDPARPAATGS